LFFLELGLELKRAGCVLNRHSFELNDRVRESIKKILPFRPTESQKKVLERLPLQCLSHTHETTLAGDVGSGKTIIALQAAIIAIENGYQVALMAPTEILATEHFISARRILEPAATASRC